MWQNAPAGYEGGYGWMHGDGGWMGMGLQGLFWILILIAVVWVIVWASRMAGGPQPGKTGAEERPSAMDILDERYARGEIDREDYMARKADLESRE
ncbi:MAG: SHOCT domain-containing protein [Alphaproteobacteria bacterium]|nr:SHOCT domain-containing protein [Alphaproteobacteria bacterium]